MCKKGYISFILKMLRIKGAFPLIKHITLQNKSNLANPNKLKKNLTKVNVTQFSPSIFWKRSQLHQILS